MADPTKYTPSYDFSDYQASSPSTPLPGAQVDIQFQALKTTTDEAIDAIKDIRRSDGALKNGIVTADSLAPGVLNGVIGETGPEGPEGPTGSQGAQGVQGPTGPTGPAGPQGIQGVQGIQGTTGAAGQSFTPDAIGPVSDQSLYDAELEGFAFLDATNGLLYFKLSDVSADWSVGAMFGRGPQGPQGVQGIQGPQGPEGPTGPEGPAVDIATTINATTEKTTPVDADEFGIWDSVSAGLRKLTWANLKATLLSSTFLWAGGAQSFTQTQQTQVRDNIDAASIVDTRRNRIVNGDMRVSQENGTTAGATNGYYPVDQWAQYFVTSAGTLTVAQVASVTPAGSPKRLRGTVTVADAALAAGEYWTLTQNLEGSNVADFQYGSASAKAGVLRFGFKGPAGTYAARVGNSAANRSFVALFTITAGQANTDTVQTIAITGDTTGTWLTADGVIGMTLEIVLAAGATFQGVAGWQAGLMLGTSGVSNGMATGSAVFEMFDVGLKLDPDATGVYGAYEVGEVDAVYRSERYFATEQGATYYASGVIYDALTAVTHYQWPVLMAKVPVCQLSSAAHFSAIVAGTGLAGSGHLFGNISTRHAQLNLTVSGGTPGQGAVLIGNASAIIYRNARLS